MYAEFTNAVSIRFMEKVKEFICGIGTSDFMTSAFYTVPEKKVKDRQARKMITMS